MTALAELTPMLPRDHSQTVRDLSHSCDAARTPAERSRVLRELALANAAFMDGWRAASAPR